MNDALAANSAAHLAWNDARYELREAERHLERAKRRLADADEREQRAWYAAGCPARPALVRAAV